MDELITLLVETTQSAGGSIGWDALMEAVPYDKRQQVMSALNRAKQSNQLHRVVRYDAKKGYDFKIVIPQGGE